MLKTARSWGIPPLELLTGKPGKKNAKWIDERNRMLAVSLTLLEDELCGGCGTPAWVGRSTNNEIAFSVKSSVCYACAELEKDRDSVSGDGKAKRRQRPGETRYISAHNVWEGKALPSRFSSYTGEGD